MEPSLVCWGLVVVDVTTSGIDAGDGLPYR